jgi:hypothetical protein
MEPVHVLIRVTSATGVISRHLVMTVEELERMISSGVPRCEWCEDPIPTYRKGKRFCSENCQKTSSRKQPRKELIS